VVIWVSDETKAKAVLQNIKTTTKKIEKMNNFRITPIKLPHSSTNIDLFIYHSSLLIFFYLF